MLFMIFLHYFYNKSEVAKVILMLSMIFLHYIFWRLLLGEKVILMVSSTYHLRFFVKVL